MQIQRNEVRTGLLVILTIGVLVAVLIYLGAPGVFVPQHTYRIYLDNAAGLRPGGQVLLAGRRIGQVRRLFSPVPEKERPTPKMETLAEVQVAADARVYQRVKVQIIQNGLLGEVVVDFTAGEESSGLAPDGHSFIAERPGTVADAVPIILEKIEPALQKATSTLESLQKTSDNLARLSSEGADLPVAFAEFRKLGTNLNQLSGPDSSLRRSLKNIETITGENGKLDEALDNLTELTGSQSPLARTLENAERFTAGLAGNKDIQITLRNFRRASEQLHGTLDDIGGRFSVVGANLEQASDTLKRQPWRLIWPATKRYPEDEVRVRTQQPVLKVRAPSPKRAPHGK